MPVNVRLRRQPPGISSSTIILRPLLAFSGITRNSSGAVLPAAAVDAFLTLTDVLVQRDISDAFGIYTISTPTNARYYIVATQPGTVDTAIVLADNASITADRDGGIGGVSDNTLQGMS